jgi:hypothetical protein
MPDAPVTAPDRDYQHFGELTMNGPKIHEWLKEMYDQVLRVCAVCNPADR